MSFRALDKPQTASSPEQIVVLLQTTVLRFHQRWCTSPFHFKVSPSRDWKPCAIKRCKGPTMTNHKMSSSFVLQGTVFVRSCCLWLCRVCITWVASHIFFTAKGDKNKPSVGRASSSCFWINLHVVVFISHVGGHKRYF